MTAVVIFQHFRRECYAVRMRAPRNAVCPNLSINHRGHQLDTRQVRRRRKKMSPRVEDLHEPWRLHEQIHRHPSPFTCSHGFLLRIIFRKYCKVPVVNAISVGRLWAWVMHTKIPRILEDGAFRFVL